MHLKFSNLVLDRPLAVIDLESTGVDPREDRVVEIATLKFLPDGRVEQYHQRINPGQPIPASATTVHGITDADVASMPPFAALAPAIHRVLRDCDLGGFGIASFDVPLLIAEFARVNMPFRIAGRAVLDALILFRRFHPRDLVSAVRVYLDRGHEGAHSAVADARAAVEVLDRQIERHGLPTTPAGLHATLVEVDVAGKFRRDVNGNPTFAFGKHAGKSLAEVAATDRAYLEWMLARPFLDDVHELIRRALARR